MKLSASPVILNVPPVSSAGGADQFWNHIYMKNLTLQITLCAKNEDNLVLCSKNGELIIIEGNSFSEQIINLFASSASEIYSLKH